MAPHRIKICGLTQPQQAEDIVRLGAAAIGVVLADSPRRAAEHQAAEVVEAALGVNPRVWCVGVFVDEIPEEINAAAKRIGLTHAQLHGRETPDILQKLEFPAIKAFRIANEESVAYMNQWLAAADVSRLAGVLVDAFSPNAAGGTGQSFAWELLAQLEKPAELPLFLAGGISHENAAEAIHAVQPDFLDASSRLESEPGVKDLDLVSALFNAVHSV